MGIGAQAGGDRTADLRLEIGQQPGGQRKEPREHHLTTKCAALRYPADAQLCASAVYSVKAAIRKLYVLDF